MAAGAGGLAASAAAAAELEGGCSERVVLRSEVSVVEGYPK